MSHDITPSHPLRELFRGLVEQVFMADLGICDVELNEYLSDMLSEFIHVDRIHRLRNAEGQPIHEIARMEAEACLSEPTDEKRRRWIIHKHIGDYTLFWTGVYPESLRRPSQADRMREYLLYGKRSYSIVSDLTRANSQPSPAVFRNLGEQFEFCVHGLRLVRNGWSRLGIDPWEAQN